MSIPNKSSGFGIESDKKNVPKKQINVPKKLKNVAF